MVYTFETPLVLPNSSSTETISELNIDMDSLTLKDVAEIETLYYKDVDNINIPDLSKKLSVRWFTKMIQVFLHKQYPHLAINENDVDKISWADANRLIMYLESSYINLQAEIIQAQYEQIILAKELDKDDTVPQETN